MLEKIELVELVNNTYALGLGIWLEKSRTLVISDLHIGYEEALNKQGIFVPRQQFKLTKELLAKMFSVVKPEEIVINGDLKHEFGEISKQEWRDTLKFLDIISEKARRVVLVKGNHDTILLPLAKRKGLEIVDFYFPYKETCITHGHKVWKDKGFLKAKILIIGNEHPAISIKEGVKSEIYKCFLVGKWKKKVLIVMPSFLPIIEGTDINREKLLSPYLQQNLSNFRVFVVGDKIYEFGKLSKLKQWQT